MRIETINGRHMLCEHIIRSDMIIPGQVWAPADGSDYEVHIISTSVHGGDVWVMYSWTEKGVRYEHEKMAFAFQCRYCLVIDKEDHK